LGSVSRTICLPIEIDKSSSTANFENGILELMLSKGKIKENNELKIK
jgi:HSP20 family molecular chaperone IbpA